MQEDLVDNSILAEPSATNHLLILVLRVARRSATAVTARATMAMVGGSASLTSPAHSRASRNHAASARYSAAYVRSPAAAIPVAWDHTYDAAASMRR